MAYVRQDVWSLAPDDPIITAYANAVEVMQQRDPSDPTSWAYQAAMHGSYSTPPLALWNTCEHGTWYFIAWHRMYVYWFEQIVRSIVIEQGGPTDWALPYWNYTPSDQGNPVLPPAFRTEGSPLYVWERRITPYNVNAGDPLPDPVTDIQPPMETVFFAPWQLPPPIPPIPPIITFAGQVTSPVHLNGGFGALEQQPHNVVHDAVGGTYGWMADVNFAAQDPIFWLHHANIDRLWASWNALGHANTSDPRWTGQAFSFFIDSKNQESKTCGEVSDISMLGYSYDRLATLPAPPPVREAVAVQQPKGAEIVGASTTPVRLTGGTAEGAVRIDARAGTEALRSLGATAPQRVVLQLDDIEAEKNPGTVYGVYVNLPAGASEADAKEHLAGSLSFFGIEGSGRRADGSDHVHAYSAGYDVTGLVERLSGLGQWDAENVAVTFHPLGVPLGTEAETPEDLPEVTIGRISVHYVG